MDFYQPRGGNRPIRINIYIYIYIYNSTNPTLGRPWVDSSH